MSEFSINARLFMPDEALPRMSSDLSPIEDACLIPHSPSDVATVIGYILLGTSHFEQNVSRLAWAFCQATGGNTDWAKRGLAQKKKALRDGAAALFASNPRITKALSALIDEPSGAANIRDSLAHGEWGFNPEAEKQIRLVNRGIESFISVDELISHNHVLARVNWVILELVNGTVPECYLSIADRDELEAVLGRIRLSQ